MPLAAAQAFVATEHPMSERPTANRFLIAATVDRLIYGNDETFSPDDARTLLDALPRKPSPWIQLGIVGKMSGGSSGGFAAGVGTFQTKNKKARHFKYTTAPTPTPAPANGS